MCKIVEIAVILLLLVACASDKPISGDRFSFHAYSEGNASNFELFSLVFKIDGKEQNFDYGRASLSKCGYYDYYLRFYYYKPDSEERMGHLREKTFTIATYLKNEANDSMTFICKRNVDIDLFETIDWKVSVHVGSYDSLKNHSQELPVFRMENGKYVKETVRKGYEFDWSKKEAIRSVYVDWLQDSVFYYEELLGKNSGYFSKEKFTEIKD